MPRLARPEGEPYLRLPQTRRDITGRQLSEKLQETAAWKAYIDQELGTALSYFSIVSVEKRVSGNSDEVLRGYAYLQAYVKRLEKLSDSFKIMYESLSRQVTIRDGEAKIQGSRRFT